MVTIGVKNFLVLLVAVIAAISPLTSIDGFSTNTSLQKQLPVSTTTTTTIMRVSTQVANDFGSAMPDTENVDPHDVIGVEPSKLAIGINAAEFLELIGTKEDLTGKIQDDNMSWNAERVEEEVDRFMMDAENVNMYLKYLKDKNENPGKYRAEQLEAELSLSNPKTIATYAAWMVGGISVGVFRTEILAPKLASGEWILPSFLSN